MYVKRFQRRYSGQPAPHSIATTDRPLLLLHKYIHIPILSQYPGTMTVYFNLLGSRCRYSVYYCWCIPETHAFVPKLCRPIIYQDKHARLSTSTLHYSRTAKKNPRIFELLKYLSCASCDELSLYIYIFVWYISPCGRPTTLLYTGNGQQGIFFRPHRGILLLYKYTGNHSIITVCSILECLK